MIGYSLIHIHLTTGYKYYLFVPAILKEGFKHNVIFRCKFIQKFCDLSIRSCNLFLIGCITFKELPTMYLI